MRALTFLIPIAAACASDLRDPLPDAAPGIDAAPEPLVETTDLGDGSFETRVNSSDHDDWVYLSLAGGAAEPVDPAADPLGWDLGFQRFHIKLNGGVSGTGAGELALIDGAALIDVAAAPADGYVTDEADLPDDEDEIDELAFETAGEGWFDYDPETHVLTPKPRAYVVRGAAGDAFALTIESYYNDAGSAARFTVTWKAL